MPTNLLAPSTGLPNSKLESANAVAGDVKSGKTFYAGDKTIKTGTLTLSGNAVVGNVLSGKTFYSNSWTKQSGSMTNRGAWTSTINPGASVTIPAGYHNGSGKVTANYGQCKQLQQTNIRSDDSFSGTYSGYQFYVVVSHSGHWSSSTSFSVSTSGCSCIINTTPVTTDFDDSLRRWLGSIQIFKANNRNSSVSFTITPNNGSHYGAAVYTVYGIG